MLRLLAAAFAAFALVACSSDGSTDGTKSSSAKVGIPSGETGGMCAGIAGIQCLNEFDYCAMPEGECLKVADLAGVCAKKPDGCTKDYRPVCGCDGNTYSNACMANAAGTSVAAQGPCGS